MGKSLFISYEELENIRARMDNILIAKILYDAGTPLPDETVFYESNCYFLSIDRLFYKGVAELFNTEIVEKEDSDDEDSEESLTVAIQFPLMEEWEKLIKGQENNPKVLESQDYFMEPIQKVDCSYVDQSMECKLIPSGIEISIEGYYGTYFEFMESMIEFRDKLQEKITEFKQRSDRDGRNSNYPKRRYGVCQSRKAV